MWFVGRPSAGKSTLAQRVQTELRSRKQLVCLLDSDEVRSALAPPPGYSPEERSRFYETLGNLASLIAHQGLLVLVAATAPLAEYRDQARKRAPRFAEVYVDVPQSECEARDAKGLYALQREGKLRNLPGVDAPFEAPTKPCVVAHGGHDEKAQAAIIEVLMSWDDAAKT